MRKIVTNDWTLVPSTSADIEAVRERCRRLVRRRAVISAGVSAIPLPGIDVVSDLSLFTLLINDINREFGLTPEQIDRLQPRLRLIAYEAAVGIGGMMVGKLITREVVLALFKRSGMKMLTKSAARVVPIAGQIASAAIGYGVFRSMGYQHVDACVAVANEVAAA
jgi:uncharacterized protein (DUF697 family)